MRNEVKFQKRMPELVKKWLFTKNVTVEERKSVNKGCQWVMKIYLRDKKALDEYQVHPEHEIVKQSLKPLVNHVFVIDTFEE